MRRAPLRRVSKKREAEGPDYDRAVQYALVRDHFECKAHARGAPGKCFGKLDPHHVFPVGEGGARCDANNLITVCRRHHDWAHFQDRKRAAKLGIITRGHR